MAFSNGPKSIVQDGLVLSTDAGNIICFTSGSSKAYSGIGSPGTGSLDNYPTYDADEGGGSWYFDGTDPDVLWEGTLADIVGTSNIQNITIECWMKQEAAVSYQGYWGSDVLSQNDGFNAYTWSDGRIYNDCNFATATPTRKYPYVDMGVPADQLVWNHIVWTYNGSNTIMYGNGIQGQSLAATGDMMEVDNAIRIGASAHGDYDGWITAFKIYNRALTQAEILQNYNATKNRFQ